MTEEKVAPVVPNDATDAKKRLFGQYETGDPTPPSVLPSDSGKRSAKLPEGVAKWLFDLEEFIRLWNDSLDWSIQVPYLYDFCVKEPFFGSLSRRIIKTRTSSISTAGVLVDDGALQLVWNPVFFKHELEKASIKFPLGVLKHELYHVVFEHITKRRQEPHVLWNVATDCAINSLLQDDELPDFCLKPGKLYVPPNPPKNWKPSLISTIVKSFPREESAEWYMNQLLNNQAVKDAMQQAKAEAYAGGGEGEGEGEGSGQGDSGGSDGKKKKKFEQKLREKLFGSDGGQFDDHEGWDKLSDEQRDMMRDTVRDLLRGASRDVMNNNSGWGSAHSSAQKYLKGLFSREIDWRDLISQFIGRAKSTGTTSSFKRVNRRVPWEFPGRKRTYSARPAVAIDQSGSMQDWWVELLFAEMSNIGTLTEYEVIPFDTAVDEKNVQTIKRGQKPNPIRMCEGGTSFDAPVEYVNKNRDRFDCLFVMTDGGCSTPKKCCVPMAYILAPGCQLFFDPGDTLVIKMKDTRNK